MKLAIEWLKIELDILKNNYDVFTKEYRQRKKRDMESLSG